MPRRLWIGLSATLLGALGVVCGPLPTWVEASRNRVRAPGPYPVRESVSRRHRGLLVADLHADSLLWGRDLLARGAQGHVDLPRLHEGQVGIQVFGLVTRAPRGQNIHRTSGESSDNITLLAMAQRWPPATWASPLQRALYQAGRLDDLARRSQAQGGGGPGAPVLHLVRTHAELRQVLARRAAGESWRLAGLLGVEGAHALEGNPENLEVLSGAGVRVLGLAHFFDNAFAGSAHGVEKYGLTEKGRDLVQRCEAAGVLVDLAHASPRSFADAVAASTRPVLVSHTGVRGTCDNARNLSDDQLRAVAATGGLVGIGFWQTATCGTDATAIARAILHAVKVAGAGHVALGSDFDGAVTTPFDASGMARITAALMDAGLEDEVLAKVMGGNVQRLLLETLPRR